MMCRLRMQNFMTIGQGVPEISVRTNRHTDLRIYYIDVDFGEFYLANLNFGDFGEFFDLVISVNFVNFCLFSDFGEFCEFLFI